MTLAAKEALTLPVDRVRAGRARQRAANVAYLHFAPSLGRNLAQTPNRQRPYYLLTVVNRSSLTRRITLRETRYCIISHRCCRYR